MRAWIIYDSRAEEEAGASEAAVYCAYSEELGETLAMVVKDRDTEWPDGVIFEYDIKKNVRPGRHELVNPRRI